jgi:hypothetical protein
MRIKKSIRGIAGVWCLLGLLMTTLITSIFAWFTILDKASVDSGQGSTASSYFAGGDGSQDSPYLIDRPIHLYNLAWLQYLGYFNKQENNVYQQKYFKLSANLDMTSDGGGWTLPPIGTSDNPFIGSFDGAGYIISNLTVDNQLGTDHITRKPTAVTSLTGVNIVGMFGVVGSYNLNSNYTYSSAVNLIKDFYLDGALIRSQLTETLIGIAVGYENASVTNVGISSSGVEVASGSTALSSGPTTNISDYTTVGYATAAYKSYHRNTETVIKTPSATAASFTYESTGTSTGEGGSIAMDSIYSRLISIRSSATATSISGAVSARTDIYAADGTTFLTTSSSTDYSGSFKEYYDSSNPLKGSFCFSRWSSYSDSSSYVYLYGGKTLPTAVTKITLGKYLIASGSDYLTVSGTTPANTTTAASALRWAFTDYGGTGDIIAVISNTVYYLYASGNGLALSTSSHPYWTQDGDYLVYNDSYYLRYSGSSWTSSSSRASSLTITEEQATSSSETSENSSFTTSDTYFPINVDSSYLPTDTNTGYIISGGSSNTSTGTFPYKYGDIRVSRYAISSISTALNANSYNSSGSNLEVITVDHRSSDYGNFVRVSDNYNGSNSSVSSTLSKSIPNTKKYTVSALGLKKYDKSRGTLNDTLSSASYLYGLHFMEATIDKNNAVKVPHAKIKKANSEKLDYTDYYMPRDSIDFNLPKRGYINFFAGTYFSNNDSFFSLHQIFRNEDDSISDIKEISKIYGDGNKSHAYYYQFSGESNYYNGVDGYADSLPTGYTEVFDTTWIKSPSLMIQNAMYYFEVPANEGEYALGSATGKIGSYLIYLDISANAQEIDRTTVLEDIITTTKTYEYPLGLSLVVTPTSDSKETVEALNSAAIALQAGYAGTMSLVKSGTTITFTSSSTAYVPGFKGDALTLAKSGSTDPPSITPYQTSVSEIKRQTYIDYNTVENKTTYVIITDQDGSETCVDGDGKSVTSYQLSDGTLTTFSSVTIDVSNLTSILATYNYPTNATYNATSSAYDYTSVTSAYTFTHEKDDSNNDLTVDKVTGYTITISSSTETLTVTVTVKDSAYAVTINGTTVEVGTALSVAAGA